MVFRRPIKLRDTRCVGQSPVIQFYRLYGFGGLAGQSRLIVEISSPLIKTAFPWELSLHTISIDIHKTTKL